MTVVHCFHAIAVHTPDESCGIDILDEMMGQGTDAELAQAGDCHRRRQRLDAPQERDKKELVEGSVQGLGLKHWQKVD